MCMVVMLQVCVYQTKYGGGYICQGATQISEYSGQGGDKAHNYTILAHPEAGASDIVITGTIIICDCMASELFNPRSTFSYVSVNLPLVRT